ncbi:MFS transporter [Nonomuraea africana]|uniref:MFS family permease n=1 Tax=Nonomuraea africana TaxID=46171 RepID=A0ABR9KHS0_9ACTN|nr:MFS transporter [Nonomuraea africana]MBE1561559.1 MFS family permease [Nonomuraea africana]
MTSTTAQKPRLLTRAFVLAVLAGCGSSVSFYLLFSVVPLYATSAGADGIGAGLTTGVMMLATVLAELATPWLLARYGCRLVFAAGLVLLGAPALVLSVSADFTAILVVCVVRGLGFAIVAVLGSALVAQAVPAERRGEGLGVYGVVCGIPSMAALPLGIWLAEAVGFPVVFVAGGVAALIGLGAVRGLPGRQPVPPDGMLVSLRTSSGLVGPSVLFAATTMAAGVVATFLPLAVAGAATALFAQSASTTVSRWWAGRYGDRHGSARLLWPGLLLAAAGMVLAAAGMVLAAGPATVLAGMVLFGAGFGVTQNASMAVMLDRVPASSYGAVSALWNIAYDLGLGAGAVGFGFVAAHTGYPAGFALTGALMLLALTIRHRKATS